MSNRLSIRTCPFSPGMRPLPPFIRRAAESIVRRQIIWDSSGGFRREALASSRLPYRPPSVPLQGHIAGASGCDRKRGLDQRVPAPGSIERIKSGHPPDLADHMPVLIKGRVEFRLPYAAHHFGLTADELASRLLGAWMEAACDFDANPLDPSAHGCESARHLTPRSALEADPIQMLVST
jgi:hypothetical protein